MSTTDEAFSGKWALHVETKIAFHKNKYTTFNEKQRFRDVKLKVRKQMQLETGWLIVCSMTSNGKHGGRSFQLKWKERKFSRNFLISI